MSEGGVNSANRVYVVAGATVFSLLLPFVASRNVRGFAPQPCVQCGSGWVSASHYWVSNPDQDPTKSIISPWERATDGMEYDGSVYADNIDTIRLFVGNRYVRGLRLHHAYFNTEPTFDPLTFWHADGPSTLVRSGPINSGSSPGYFEVPGTGNLRTSRTPVLLEFSSDFSNGRQGFVFDDLQVCCAGSQAPTPVANATWGRRHEGALLGTGDVVYFKLSAAPSAAYAIHLPFWAISPVSPTLPLSMHVRCGALPTASTYDFASSTASRWGYLRVPYQSWCGTSWYVAISSDGGSGTFSFVPSLAKVGEEKTLRVGIEFNATTTEMETLGFTLVDAARRYYGATEGQQMVTRFDVYNNRGANCAYCPSWPNACDVCWEVQNTQASRVYGHYKMYIRHDDAVYGSYIISHELGHLIGWLDDEYCSPSDPDCSPAGCKFCGHGLMGLAHGNNLCDDSNHKEDIAPNDQCSMGSGPTISSWSALSANSKIAFIPNETPDNFDYLNHNFSDAINWLNH